MYRHTVVIKCMPLMAKYTGSACEMGTYEPRLKSLGSVNLGDQIAAINLIYTTGYVPAPETSPVYIRILYGVPE